MNICVIWVTRTLLGAKGIATSNKKRSGFALSKPGEHDPATSHDIRCATKTGALLLVASLLLVVRPGAPRSFLFLVRPGAPSSVLVPSSKALVTSSSRCKLRCTFHILPLNSAKGVWTWQHHLSKSLLVLMET